MKKILFNGQLFEADKIIKTETDIIGEDTKGNRIFAFRGIADFSLFQLEIGQEWDLSKEDEEALTYLDLDFRISKIELGV